MVDLPATAAWRHLVARDGFEVLFPRREADGYRFDGYTTAVEDGQVWWVCYAITLDASWAPRSARVSSRSAAGEREVQIEADGAGEWRIDGTPAPELAGLLDVDLEASAFTNAFPVHRLALDVGQQADAPAVYVRAPHLAVERLEQRYRRLVDGGNRRRYDYAAPDLGFAAVLAYDERGFVLDYPGIAVRIA